jgi:hypothetical protein
MRLEREKGPRGIPNTMRRANVILGGPRANYVTVTSTGFLRNSTKVTDWPGPSKHLGDLALEIQ